jgi:hypothetical protein
VFHRRAKHARRKPKRASEVLLDARDKARANGAERVTVGEVLDGAGARIYGLALLLFALPEAIPFPAIGLSGIVAIPIIVVSGSMLLFGMQHRLPAWVRRRSIKRSWVEKLVEKGAPLVRRVERVSHPRLKWWAEAGRPLGLLCIGLSLLMAVPVPFSNVAPGLAVVAIGMGIFQRDGLLVLLAASVGVLMLGIAAYAAFLVGEAVS